MTLGSKDWRSVRPRADLSILPQEVDLSPSRIGGMMGMGFGGVWLFMSWNLVGQTGDAPWWATAFTLIFPGIGGAIFLGGFVSLFRRRKATFRSDGVEVEGNSLLGRESWHLPYSDFMGILHREVVVRGKNSSRTYQIVELLHMEPKKCLPLFVDTGREKPRGRWEAYAKQLKVPALLLEGEKLVQRDHRDLDKSLKELAREGKIVHGFDSAGPPPKGLYVENGADRLKVVITAPRYPWWFLAVFLAAGVAMALGALSNEKTPLVLLLGGVLFAGVSAYMFYRDRRSQREVYLDRQGLRVVDSMKTSHRTPERVSFNDEETVTLRKAPSNLGQEVVIAGDQGEIHVGVGLSREALAWLKDYLTAAIATA